MHALALTVLSWPEDTVPCLARSLSSNTLCGITKTEKEVYDPGNGAATGEVFVSVSGTFTTDCITALCEGLNGSALTALK